MAKWRSEDHPRDWKGRFINVGAPVNISGLGVGRVTDIRKARRAGDIAQVQVQAKNGQRSWVPIDRVTTADPPRNGAYLGDGNVGYVGTKVRHTDEPGESVIKAIGTNADGITVGDANNSDRDRVVDPGTLTLGPAEDASQATAPDAPVADAPLSSEGRPLSVGDHIQAGARQGVITDIRIGRGRNGADFVVFKNDEGGTQHTAVTSRIRHTEPPLPAVNENESAPAAAPDVVPDESIASELPFGAGVAPEVAPVGISATQRESVLAYLSEAHGAINGVYLREGRDSLTQSEKNEYMTDMDEVRRVVPDMDAVIASSTLTNDAVVYRGLTVTGDFNPKNWQDGTRISDAGFGSTTSDLARAKWFARENSKNVLVEMHLPAGANVLDVASALPDDPHAQIEKEFTLPRGYEIEVFGRGQTDDGMDFVRTRLVPKGATSKDDESIDATNAENRGRESEDTGTSPGLDTGSGDSDAAADIDDGPEEVAAPSTTDGPTAPFSRGDRITVNGRTGTIRSVRLGTGIAMYDDDDGRLRSARLERIQRVDEPGGQDESAPSPTAVPDIANAPTMPASRTSPRETADFVPEADLTRAVTEAAADGARPGEPYFDRLIERVNERATRRANEQNRAAGRTPEADRAANDSMREQQDVQTPAPVQRPAMPYQMEPQRNNDVINRVTGEKVGTIRRDGTRTEPVRSGRGTSLRERPAYQAYDLDDNPVGGRETSRETAAGNLAQTTNRPAQPPEVTAPTERPMTREQQDAATPSTPATRGFVPDSELRNEAQGAEARTFDGLQRALTRAEDRLSTAERTNRSNTASRREVQLREEISGIQTQMGELRDRWIARRDERENESSPQAPGELDPAVVDARRRPMTRNQRDALRIMQQNNEDTYARGLLEGSEEVDFIQRGYAERGTDGVLYATEDAKEAAIAVQAGQRRMPGARIPQAEQDAGLARTAGDLDANAARVVAEAFGISPTEAINRAQTSTDDEIDAMTNDPQIRRSLNRLVMMSPDEANRAHDAVANDEIATSDVVPPSDFMRTGELEQIRARYGSQYVPVSSTVPREGDVVRMPNGNVRRIAVAPGGTERNYILDPLEGNGQTRATSDQTSRAQVLARPQGVTDETPTATGLLDQTRNAQRNEMLDRMNANELRSVLEDVRRANTRMAVGQRMGDNGRRQRAERLVTEMSRRIATLEPDPDRPPAPEFTDRNVLDAINNENMDTGELAQTFGIPQPQMLRALRRLEDQGFVVRHSGEHGGEDSVSGGRSRVSDLGWETIQGRDGDHEETMRAYDESHPDEAPAPEASTLPDSGSVPTPNDAADAVDATDSAPELDSLLAKFNDDAKAIRDFVGSDKFEDDPDAYDALVRMLADIGSQDVEGDADVIFNGSSPQAELDDALTKIRNRIKKQNTLSTQPPSDPETFREAWGDRADEIVKSVGPEMRSLVAKFNDSSNHDAIIQDLQRMYSTQGGLGKNKDYKIVIDDISGYNNGAGGRVGYEGAVVNKNGRKVGTIQRSISFDEYGEPTEVHNDYLALDRNVQGQGIAKDIYRQQENWFINQGVPKVTIHANIDVGGYAWARAGYDYYGPGAAAAHLSQVIGKARRSGATAAQTKWLQDARKAAIAASRDPRFDLDSGVYDPDAEVPYPTPYEVSQLGYTPGAQNWVGKDMMLGTDWMAVKRLDRQSDRSDTSKDKVPNAGGERLDTGSDALRAQISEITDFDSVVDMPSVALEDEYQNLNELFDNNPDSRPLVRERLGELEDEMDNRGIDY